MREWGKREKGGRELPVYIQGFCCHSNHKTLLVILKNNCGLRTCTRTYLSKDGRLLGRVAEGVDVPGHTGSGVRSKGLFHKLETESHLVDDGVVVGGGLVVHAPASVDKLKLLVGHQFLHL